jgi:hypothetical protein
MIAVSQLLVKTSIILVREVALFQLSKKELPMAKPTKTKRTMRTQNQLISLQQDLIDSNLICKETMIDIVLLDTQDYHPN